MTTIKRTRVKFQNAVINIGNVRIESDGSLYNTKIFYDGEQQLNIMSFRIEGDVRKRSTRITLSTDAYIRKRADLDPAEERLP